MANQVPNELSERELDILKLVATGASNKEIAQKLFISSNTVKVHLRNIFSKINASSRTEAAMYAVRLGIVENASAQLTEDVVDEPLESSLQSTQNLESFQSVENQVAEINKKKPQWAFYIFIVGILGILFLGWRLSPGLARFTKPTATTFIPQDTATPIPHWNYLSPLPLARSNLAIVAYDNQIYTIGGVNILGVTGQFDRFDPQMNTWLALRSKPVPVFDIQAEVINGSIYIPGGRTSVDNLQPTDILEIYNTSTNLWQTGASLPIPLSAYGLVAYDGSLYIFGGWDGQNYRNEVFSYIPATDSWQELTPMQTARGFCAAVEAGGKIFVIGGINENHSVDVNEIYSPVRDTINGNPWSSGFPIPENRLGIQAVTIADTIYIFGGEAQNSNRIGLIYFPQTNVWQSLETSPYPLGEDFGMTAIGTNVFIMGGKYDTTFSDQNLTYQAIITLSIPIIIK